MLHQFEKVSRFHVDNATLNEYNYFNAADKAKRKTPKQLGG